MENFREQFVRLDKVPYRRFFKNSIKHFIRIDGVAYYLKSDFDIDWKKAGIKTKQKLQPVTPVVGDRQIDMIQTFA